MDEELVSPTFSCSPPSLSSAPGVHPVLEFVSFEVPDQWLVGDDDPSFQEGAAWAPGGSRSAGSDLSGNPPAMAERAAKRWGRRPGPRSEGPTISHVEAEQQRRDKLNRRFCDLRAAVPTVSRLDKASLLADATAYIGELRGRVERLETEAKQQAAAAWKAPSAAAASHALCLEEKLEVRMVGRDAAALRLMAGARHAPARLMVALRALDLPVQHACVSSVGAVTVQDAVVDVPAALQDEGSLLQKCTLQTVQKRHHRRFSEPSEIMGQ